MPATWPGEDPLAADPFDRDPRPTPDLFVEVGLDAAANVLDRLNEAEVAAGRPPFPRVEVSRKTEPIPRVTVTPPAGSATGELARRVRDNLARLETDERLPEALRSVIRNTLGMAERTVDEAAVLEEQYDHTQERFQRERLLSHRRALALSLRCVELNTSEEQRAELADLLKKHQAEPQTPLIVPNIPTVPVYSIDELARAVAERITHKLAAEPLLRLLDAAREWVECPPDGDMLDNLGGVLVDCVEACKGIDTGRRQP